MFIHFLDYNSKKEVGNLKKKIEEFLAGNKKAYIRLMDLEKFLKQANGGSIGIHFYKELGEAIIALEKEQKIEAVKSSKKYAMNMKIADKYRKVKGKQEITKEHENEIHNSYHFKMEMNHYINDPARYEKDKDILKRISSFLSSKREGENFLSVNERSFELFGAEKLLLSSHGQKVLSTVNITMEDLCCFRTYEPFFYYGSPLSPDGSILIVENKDTFTSFKKLFINGVRSWEGVTISMLIYGEGNKITSSISFLEELGVPKATPIYYFGDFDPEGIDIYDRLRKATERKIHLFEGFYRVLWERRKGSKVDTYQTWNRDAIDYFLSIFQEKEQIEILQYLENKKYVPQEALNIERLRRLSDGT